MHFFKKEKAWKGVVFPEYFTSSWLHCVCVKLQWTFLANQERRRPRIDTRFSAYRISTMSSGHAAVNPHRSGLKQINQTNKQTNCCADTAVFRYCTCHLISSTWVAAAKGLLQPHPHFFFFTAYDVHAVTPPLRVGELLRNPPSSPFEETPDSNVPLSLPVSSLLGGHE